MVYFILSTFLKRIADVNNEAIIKKLRAILIPGKKMDATERLMANPELVKEIKKAREDIKAGKGVKIAVDDLWK